MLYKKIYLFKIFVGCIIVSSIVSCSNGDSSKLKKEKYSVIRAIMVDTVVSKEYVAEIQASRNVEIRSRISGFIEKIHVDEGQFVQEGQILFSLNDAGIREEMNQAEAQYRSSIADSKVIEVELMGSKRLLEKNIISQSEYDMLQARFEAAVSRVEESKSILSNARLMLTYCYIKAPFSGNVNRLPVKAGSLISEGDLLTTISDDENVFAYFNLSESEYLNYKQDKGFDSEINLILANGVKFSENGKIEAIESEIDRSTGNIAFRARFANSDRLLKHGASGKVVLNTILNNALIIPQKSSFEIQDRICVFLINDSNVATIRQIVPRFRLGDLYVISSGLNSDDRVLYEGIQSVKEGDVLDVVLLDMEKIKN